MEKPFVIYRSSAGSGKTYTLALEYLKLALTSPSAFRSILAVTFTNKATREMKSRILLFLYELSKGNNPTLSRQLEVALNFEKDVLQKRAEETLSHMLHGYSFVSVMTIDAFFQKVIRAFARELGLQAGFALELDQEKVLDDVVDQLLSEISDDQHLLLRQWMIRFAEEKVEAGKVWDFRRDLKQLARELFKEDYKVRQEELRIGEDTKGTEKYQQILKELKEIVARYVNAMQSFGEKGLSHMQKYGLEFTDFAYGKSGVGNYFARMVEGSDYEPKKRSLDAAENPDKWSTKKSPKKEIISEAVESGLQSILQQTIAYYEEENIKYQSARQLLKFIYAYGILQDISNKLQAYKQDNDVMLISDSALFLRDIIGQDDTPFVYEKIGSSFQHFLIDEFQDTSGLQWGNFRPLVENSLDSGHRNLVVGDVKQSIYRWRGGDWQLLLEKIEQDIAPWKTEVKHLDSNFRSLPHIIDFNNSLFKHLPLAIEQEIGERITNVDDVGLQEILQQRAGIIQQAYEDAQQKLPDHRSKIDWKGHVEINLLSREDTGEEEESMNWKDQVKSRIPKLVEDLQDRGCHLRDIAFLVRDKKAGKEIVDTLMQYKNAGYAREGYNYELISSESLFLSASLTVGFMIEVLRFLDNHENDLAKGSMIYKYFKLKKKDISSGEMHRIFTEAGTPPDQDGHFKFFMYFPEEFTRSFHYLNKLPLYELVENLISIFHLNEGDELAYLQAFQDAVLQYSGQETGDLHTFLYWWDEKGQQTSVQVSEDVDAMRILTIHKSKGLQFKVVLIPFCDWDLDHRPGQDNIIWTEVEREPFASFGLMPMRYSSQLAGTVFSRDYYEEMIRAYIDNLNLLYVAFTRAEESLIAFAAPRISKRGECKLNSVANALHLMCVAEEDQPAIKGSWNETERKFSLGEPFSERIKDDNTEITKLPDSYPSHRWRDRISVRPLARGFFEMDEEGKMHINRAVIRRDVLARLKNSKELRTTVELVYHDRGINREECNEIFLELEEALKQPPLKQWFAEEENSRVAMNLITQNGRQYSPDRSILGKQQATLVQFDDDTDRSRSLRQLSGSANALAVMGYKVEAFLYNTVKMSSEMIDFTTVEESQSESAQ